MNFTKTQTRNGTRYYIDGKRVTENEYEWQQVVCGIKNMRYNTSYCETKPNGVNRQVFHYN